jgi:hypothetical protein
VWLILCHELVQNIYPLENIKTRLILFRYRHQQWRTDEAQVRPSNLVDSEEWKADYYIPNLQLNERVRD